MLYWVFYDLFSHGSVWLFMLLTLITAILPDLVIDVVERLINSYKIRKYYISPQTGKSDEHVASDKNLSEQSTIVTPALADAEKKDDKKLLSHQGTFRNNKVGDSSLTSQCDINVMSQSSIASSDSKVSFVLPLQMDLISESAAPSDSLTTNALQSETKFVTESKANN
jgi:hypothetical protein